MKAKKTAINIRKSVELPKDTSFLNMIDFADKVAEISFKAGYDKALAQLANMAEECKQMGRKEVVEWMRDKRFAPSPLTAPDCYYYRFGGSELQAKLKEWGIE